MPSLRSGEVIDDRFVIRDRLGGGGMGNVYRALDRESGAVVVVKTFGESPRGDDARSLREIDTLARLEHEAIVRYIAHGHLDSGAPFLVMEWIDGEDLAAHLARGSLSWADTLELAIRLASALAHAHARGVIHRDIKPANIVLRDHLIAGATLVDFGIARVESAGLTALTGTGALLGTPGYMAPEQARGASDLNPSVDTFALGCVLFECLAGRPAFHGPTLMATLASVLLDTPPALSSLGIAVPPRADALIARMLAKNPDSRPTSEAVFSLRTELDESGVSSDEPASVTVASARERRVVCIVLIGSLAAPHGYAETVHAAVTESPRALMLIAEQHHARLESLADGTRLLVIEGSASASERVLSASRCARAARGVVSPLSPIVVATGLAATGERVPIGGALARAAQMVGEPEAQSEVLLDDTTAALVGAWVDVSPLVGRERTFVLGLERARPTGLLLGRPTPFVGRERELGSIQAIADECVAEAATRVVIVHAPPGQGKSRLRAEVMDRLRVRAEAFVIWSTRAVPAPVPVALQGCAGLILAACGAEGDPRARRQKLDVWCEGLAMDRVDSAFLAALIGAEVDAPEVARAREQPELLADGLSRAFHRAFACASEASPVLVVMDDAQWLDRQSLELLREIPQRCPGRSLLCLLFARPEGVPALSALMPAEMTTTVALTELSARAIERLARSALGDTADSTILAAIIAAAGGNPFFAEELVRASVHGKVGPLPDSILATVQARMDGLSPGARQVARIASIFGTSFPADALAPLVGKPNAEVQELVAELTQAEIFSGSSAATGPRMTGGAGLILPVNMPVELRFRHALTREAAYASWAEEDRPHAHLAVADWLVGRPNFDDAMVGEQYALAGSSETAARHFATAADAALAHFDVEGALALVARGRDSGSISEALRADLNAVAASALANGGRAVEAIRVAEEVLAVAEPPSNSWYRALAARSYGGAIIGDREVSLAGIDDLVRFGAGGRLARYGIEAATRMLVGSTINGWKGPAIESLRAVLDDAVLALDLEQNLHTHALWHGERSLAAWMSGSFGDAYRSMGIAAELYARAGDRMRNAIDRGNQAQILMMFGAIEQAESQYRELIALSGEFRVVHAGVMWRSNLGLVLIAAGKLDEAEGLLRDSIEHFRAQKSYRMVASALSGLALLALARGDLQRATALAREAVLESDIAQVRASCLGILARALLLMGEPDAALAASREAMLVVDQGQHLEENEEILLLAHAEALHATGQRVEALDAIRKAHARITKIASGIGDPVLEASYLEVPTNARTAMLAQLWAEESSIA